MRIQEAVELGNSYIQQNYGVCGDPDLVKLEVKNGRKSWMLLYPSSLINAEETKSGDIIDGGECILNVDWHTRDVVEFG